MEIDKRKNDNKTKVESTRGFVYDKPECDIYETDNEYKIYFDVPGVEKSDINLNVEKDVLTLTANCSKEPVKDYDCLREEMRYTGYKRSFELNNTVNTEKINADYENGSLLVTLPKREEQKTKEIQINVH